MIADDDVLLALLAERQGVVLRKSPDLREVERSNVSSMLPPQSDAAPCLEEYGAALSLGPLRCLHVPTPRCCASSGRSDARCEPP